ncbi:hypothetical protein [Spirillospora sp. NPDC047279]|uniref:hypothetical protein n=1 Tax=Spirillospora sp. NPDC047279 TaxID=3155478 RepID=UPI0034063099
MPDTPQPTGLNLQGVRTRNLNAREIVSALSEAMPTIADMWLRLNAALADTPALTSEIKRLAIELARARRGHANLVAAARATLNAHQDGEPDPLYYLSDELRAQGQLPPDTWGRP